MVIVWGRKQGQRCVCILDGIQEVSGALITFDDVASPAVDGAKGIRRAKHSGRRVELVVANIDCVDVRGGEVGRCS